jgi:transcriptional regulator with PAS, ATPase and Fis domain
VLILGETGVGKEVFAERLHAKSRRAPHPLLKLNCGGFTENLLDSELFGHEKGSFTGADKAKPGLLEMANGGSVFLDEIGELPLGLQARLLRVLQDRKVQRIGALEPRAIDVRFIAATNRDLAAEVTAGRFRQDLYYRLNGITLSIPPLRARNDEIAGFARRFLAEATAQTGRTLRLARTALARLEQHAWPGNIRELRNVIERAALICPDDEIAEEHLQLGAEPVEPASGSLHADVESLERRRIVEALEACGGNQTRAAQKLGISRGTLLARLKQFGITRPRS